MRRIRKPKHGRLVALLIALLAVLFLLAIDSWLPSIILVILALILVSIGKNYWECTTCGTLTERV